MSHAHAYSPEEAEKLISARLKKIDQMRVQKMKAAERARSPQRRAAIKKQLASIENMRDSPFDLIVSDINMPDMHPVGVEFARGLRQRFPKMRVLMHSDDLEFLADLEEEGIPSAFKSRYDQKGTEAQLKKRMMEQLRASRRSGGANWKPRGRAS